MTENISSAFINFLIIQYSSSYLVAHLCTDCSLTFIINNRRRIAGIPNEYRNLSINNGRDIINVICIRKINAYYRNTHGFLKHIKYRYSIDIVYGRFIVNVAPELSVKILAVINGSFHIFALPYFGTVRRIEHAENSLRLACLCVTCFDLLGLLLSNGVCEAVIIFNEVIIEYICFITKVINFAVKKVCTYLGTL